MILLNESWPRFSLGAFMASCRARSALHHSSHLLFSSSLLLHPGRNRFLCLCKVLLKAVKEQHEGTLKSRSAYFVMNKSSQMWHMLSVWDCFVLWGRQKRSTSGSADEKWNQRHGWASWWWWWWWWWRVGGAGGGILLCKQRNWRRVM